MPIDKKDVMTELEELNLEEARHRVGQMKSVQRLRASRRLSIERQLRAEMQRETTIQAVCWHKKGGKGVEMMYQGNDPNYAVIKHIFPLGEMKVFCQRCGKVWEPPPAHLNQRGATTEDRKLYARLYQEYRQALNFPTDNETSGTQLFMVSTAAPQYEAAS